MNKKLSQLISGIEYISIQGDIDTEVTSIYFDSKTIEAGAIFVALVGSITDGHLFINDAIDKGAKVIVYEKDIDNFKDDVVYIKTDDSHKFLSLIASNFYDDPSKNFKLIGVTGTNGKTTISFLLYSLFLKLGFKAGLISTVGDKVLESNTNTRRVTPTTPDSVSLQKMLKEMADADCEYVFMEVSSHSLSERRMLGVNFAGGIYTNLTHDHLDYHNTLENYRDAKKILFDILPPEAFALVNIDDENGEYMIRDSKAKKYTYSLKKKADYNEVIESKLVGEFNSYNILAVYATALLLGQDQDKVRDAIKTLNPAPGRFESFVLKNKTVGVVDYAHTPDAIQNVLKTIRGLTKGKIITVVGCGGDRDKTKRPIMGKIAYEYSDIVILTSDNPRSEDPNAILMDIKNGIENPEEGKLYIIQDRREAIDKAYSLSSEGDYIALLGKGHENYQEVNGIKTIFNDTEELQKYI